MSRLTLTLIGLIAALLGGIAARAHALTTEQGSMMQGNYVNVADPDEKQGPGFLKPSGEQRSLSPDSDRFNGEPGHVDLSVSPSMSMGPDRPQHPVFSDQFGSER